MINVFLNEGQNKAFFLDEEGTIEVFELFTVLNEDEVTGNDDEEVPEEITTITAPERKPRKTTTCKRCKQEGHTVKTCKASILNPDDTEETTVEHGPLIDRRTTSTLTNDQLAEKITKLWLNEERSSVEVCERLSISLSKMNDIIFKYKIQRPTR